MELHHQISGADRSGTPLLLVHGGAGLIAVDWAVALPLLSRNRPVIAVELQGHGHTPHADRAYTFENNADDLADLVDDLGLSRVDLMAFSNGVPTALAFARRHPAVTGRLVLASGFFARDGFVPGFWDGFADNGVDTMPTELADGYRRIHPDPADLERMFALDQQLMLGFDDLPEAALTGLAGPALVLVGDHDIVTVEHSQHLADLIPDGRLLVLPAGHGDYLGAGGAQAPVPTPVAATLALVEHFLDGGLDQH